MRPCCGNAWSRTARVKHPTSRGPTLPTACAPSVAAPLLMPPRRATGEGPNPSSEPPCPLPAIAPRSAARASSFRALPTAAPRSAARAPQSPPVPPPAARPHSLVPPPREMHRR
ncbi:unnamed protein product [Urochloa humidicola]